MTSENGGRTALKGLTSKGFGGAEKLHCQAPPID